MFETFQMELAGRPLIIETGKMAKQASGSVLVRYGDTVVLVATTWSKEPREGTDFFPLTVDYEEKMYSVGKMPGGFLRREGRPGNSAVLNARLIDRPIRPLFDKRCRHDVHVVATVLSVDYDNAPELCGLLGASASIAISDIPWDGPVAGVRVGKVDG
ncbi:MAG: polyribonucleotide nucleotidyltransferase, partial [Dialister micraerophilus]|nr:polyribonucleotide nucleotidyltransferase [Dialister micraerophilus]